MLWRDIVHDMKYTDDETSSSDASRSAPLGAAAIPPRELQELAHEMRALWHRVKSGIVLTNEVPGLQRHQHWVLGALAAGPRRMSDLAECAQTSQTSLTGIVDRLEEHGLVARTRSAEDRRVVEVALTEQGRRAGEAAESAYLTRLAQVIEPLDADERAEFKRLLRKLVAPDERC